MQYHVVADVAWNVLNYYYCTDDEEFMLKYGMEMLCDISEYWVSRVENKNGRYEKVDTHTTHYFSGTSFVGNKLRAQIGSYERPF